ncbi:hypothetical protein [Mesorhizobium sp. M7A.F.Ca.US.010.02.1.1]|uniref:hypothetical protein n=1 Tax=Mesorhizobium sp. M7A.F.Ca.US.010.02.1.1 TaxID=2496743 RepID=UPI001FDF4B30|nr:hypothetical protein [Mesorhizobium sp. M7A.F.Ca.US.010.02.1.1]
MRASPGSDKITEYVARRVREYLDENFARKVVANWHSSREFHRTHFIARFAMAFGMPPHRGELPKSPVSPVLRIGAICL